MAELEKVIEHLKGIAEYFRGVPEQRIVCQQGGEPFLGIAKRGE